MSAVVQSADVAHFRAVLGTELGLAFDESRVPLLAEALAKHIGALGITAASYLDRLRDSVLGPRELTSLIPEITVAETYFFRHGEQLRAFAEVAVPDRLAARAGERRLQLLSAGCASGEEAFTLAILLRELDLSRDWEVGIRAVDVNPGNIVKAKRARYSEWAMRETPAEIRRRYFTAEGREMALDRSILDAVHFEERNLAREDPELWEPGRYDVIFCRNVMMYFTAETIRTLVARMVAALAPQGYLFLGHAETLRGISADLDLRHTHETFYYQSKADGRAPRRWQAAPVASRPLARDPAWASTWVDSVQRSTERIQTLTESTAPREADGPSAPSPAPARPEVAVALELLKQERFAEALALIGARSTSAAVDSDALLLRAVLLSQSGQHAPAEEVCAHLLAVDGLSAGAHYIRALCRESLGDPTAAKKHLEIATYLDPSFVMPRIHLGIHARRAGDRETARRELDRAVLLLQGEDASRILLFGGGFGRDGLAALCRAELARLGGGP